MNKKPIDVLTRAWLWALVAPASMVPAILIGEGITALLGYSDLTAVDAPLWVKLAAGVPAYGLMLFAGVMALRTSLKAKADRGKAAWLPLGLSAAFLAYILVMTIGSAIELTS